MTVEVWVYPPDSCEPVLYGRYKYATPMYPPWFVALVYVRSLWPLSTNPRETMGVFMRDRWVFYPDDLDKPIIELRFKDSKGGVRCSGTPYRKSPKR